MTKQVLTNFSKGELGPELYGRIDTPQYSAGVKLARNFIVQKYGGLAFRPGFIFVAEADDADTEMRYFSFDYGIEYPYVLAFQNQAFRPLTLGGAVLEPTMKIAAVTRAAQAVITIGYHELEVGDRFFIDGVTGMTELNGQFGTVLEVLDIHRVRVDIDTSGYAPFSASNGTTRTAPPPSPPAPPPAPPAPPAPAPAPPVGGGGGSGGGWGYNGNVWNTDIP